MKLRHGEKSMTKITPQNATSQKLKTSAFAKEVDMAINKTRTHLILQIFRSWGKKKKKKKLKAKESPQNCKRHSISIKIHTPRRKKAAIFASRPE